MNREEAVLAWLRRQQRGERLALPGDDAAVLGRGASARAVTTDQQIAGVHVPADLDPVVWARRLLAVNLSDLAAMGAEPEAALLTLAVPDGFPVKRFLEGAIDACRRRGIPLVGGDLARSPCAVTAMTVTGRRRPGGGWVGRDSAVPGDVVWVGGPLGLSAVGQRLVARGARLAANRVSLPVSPRLSSKEARGARRAVRRHLSPTPQLELGAWLARRRRAAAIDVSDGFTLDLSRLLEASGCGAAIETGALPIAPEVAALAPKLGENARELALAGGEDYVLLFTLPPSVQVPGDLNAVAVGRATESRELRLVGRSGSRPIEPAGWDHLSAARSSGRES